VQQTTPENTPQQYRQGDVLIVALSAIPLDQIQYAGIPADAVPVRRGPHGLLLAEGKATSHHHSVKSEAAELYTAEGVLFLRATAAVEVTHEEHDTIALPPGEYRVSGHHEAQPGELPRQVED